MTYSLVVMTNTNYHKKLWPWCSIFHIWLMMLNMSILCETSRSSFLLYYYIYLIVVNLFCVRWHSTVKARNMAIVLTLKYRSFFIVLKFQISNVIQSKKTLWLKYLGEFIKSQILISTEYLQHIRKYLLNRYYRI